MNRGAASLWIPTASLWRREMVRFFRQRSRVTGSLLTPLLFWILFSAGYGPSFNPGEAAGGTDVGSFAFFFPGTVTLIILFTSIFANISIIEDRKEGFLQGVLVAPVPRASIVLGKVLGGASIAIVQALLLVAIAALAGVDMSFSFLALVAIVALSLALSALGFCFAWRLDSVQGFHAVMNVVLMPLWLLSGALFPSAGTPAALRLVMNANPVSYGLALMRHGLGVATPDLPSLGVSFAVTAGFAAVTLAAAAWLAGSRGAQIRAVRPNRDENGA